MKCIINMNNTRIITFLTVCIFIVNTNNATSWDLGITIGQDVVFLFNNRTIAQNRSNQDINKLYSTAYDAESDKIFVSASIAKKHSKMSIFVDNMNSNDTKMNKLLDHIGSITQLAYDSLSHTLFWTDYHNHAIFKLYIDKNMKESESEILFNFTNQFPHGLSLDLCHQRLYWTNSDWYNSTIMSSNIDGTNSTIIVNENLYAPLAITVDYFTSKLYWIDDSEGNSFKIERSNLDGTNREIVISGKHQQPVQIAVDHSKIYWIDWVHTAIWYKEKNSTGNDNPVKWLSLEYYNDNDDQPRDLFTRDYIKNIDCSMMDVLKHDHISNQKDDNDRYQYAMSNISNVDYEKMMKSPQICLNDGYFNETIEVCQCIPGFYGKYCEQFPCQNYCLHGECKMTADSQVYCECHSEYEGLRCEKHICSDYCLNGGECSIRQGEPFCSCKFSQGNRCEISYNIAEICFTHTRTSQLSESNKSEVEFDRNIVNEEYNIESYNSWTQIVIVILSTIISILTVLIIVLGYFVNKFRSRPQIKKTFIVKKTNIPPYAVGSENPHASCDTTIETCCNMSICETPCVELQMKNLSASLTKKDDRCSIIDNMYGNCSP